MIVLRNVEKYFEHGPTKTFVLRRINAEVKEGEFISIMGPSGAGKSTLLHLLGMHDSAWTGEYYLAEHAIHKLAKKDRMELYKKYFGFVFQSYHLLDSLTVYENLDIPLSYRNIKKSERDSIVCDVLDRFQIVGKKDLYPNQLSGGQQQLVAIARAIVASPKVILADEPTGNLHSSQGKEIMELFKTLERGGHHHHSSDPQREERGIRAPRDQYRRWLDRELSNEGQAMKEWQSSAAPRILIADDQADVLEALRLLLEGRRATRSNAVNSPAGRRSARWRRATSTSC